MIDPKSQDFAHLVHNWCEMQRMNENIYIINKFDNPDTRSTKNFYRNSVLNAQIQEAKNSIHPDSDNPNLNQFSSKNAFEENNVQIAEQSNSIAHSLLQNQNIKLHKMNIKLDELNKENQENI